jgi:hypothetical protein
MDSRGDLTIETEQGVVVDSLGVYIGDLCAIIEQLAPENLNATHCLQYIDPDGDTVFNMLQKERLVLELKEMNNGLLPGAEAETLARVIDFVNRYKERSTSIRKVPRRLI